MLTALLILHCFDFDFSLGYKISQWLEQGIFSAIDMRYVRSVTVAVLSEDKTRTNDKPDVLESFW